MYIEVRHIGQGQPLAYIVNPDKSWVCSACCAFRMAINSACPLISYFSCNSLTPSAIISSSFTMTAPNGCPPSRTFSASNSTVLSLNGFISHPSSLLSFFFSKRQTLLSSFKKIIYTKSVRLCTHHTVEHKLIFCFVSTITHYCIS